MAAFSGGAQATFTQGFTWSDLGAPATVTYPQKSGVGPARTVTFDLSNGWLSRVHEGTTDYASSISYHANGMVNQVAHGNTTTDIFGKDANDIARPASVSVRSPFGATMWTTGAYTYDGSGNVWKMTNGGSIDTFVYDKVSRLLEGTIASVSKKQCLVYDTFGNVRRADVIVSSGTCATTPSIDIDPTTNRINLPVTYDAAGEQLSWNSGAYTYAWYPTGQMRQFDGSGRTTIHGFTADGERIATYDSVLGATTYTIRGLDGKVLRVYRDSGTWSWLQDDVYRDGAHLATIDGTGTRHFHLDHLGSIRLITNSSGSQVALHTYVPFGQEASGTGQDAERMKFTGHERDLRDPSNTTDDLDYMHARHYNPNLARFLSVDPGRDVDPTTPQGWNMYAYVRNNPMVGTDPTGRDGLFGLRAADWPGVFADFGNTMGFVVAYPLLKVGAGIMSDSPAQVGTGALLSVAYAGAPSLRAAGPLASAVRLNVAIALLTTADDVAFSRAPLDRKINTVVASSVIGVAAPYARVGSAGPVLSATATFLIKQETLQGPWDEKSVPAGAASVVSGVAGAAVAQGTAPVAGSVARVLLDWMTHYFLGQANGQVARWYQQAPGDTAKR